MGTDVPHLPPRISVQQRDVEITSSGDWAMSHCITRLINADTNENAAAGLGPRHRLLPAPARRLARNPRTRLSPLRSHDRQSHLHTPSRIQEQKSQTLAIPAELRTLPELKITSAT